MEDLSQPPVTFTRNKYEININALTGVWKNDHLINKLRSGVTKHPYLFWACSRQASCLFLIKDICHCKILHSGFILKLGFTYPCVIQMDTEQNGHIAVRCMDMERQA